MAKTSFQNAVLLITGANRGIGKALVEVALERGAKKIYACARKPETLKELTDKGKGRVVALALDITSQEQIQNAAKQAPDVTLLINNAGVAAYVGFTVNHKAQGARDEMEVNYFGAINMSAAFVPVIKKNGGGTIVNIVSVAAFQSFEGFGTYCASKAAEHSFTVGLRQELAGQGIAVVGVYPGPIDTDMAHGVEMEKETPRQAALNIYKGLDDGEEEIFPDKYSLEFSHSLKL